MNPFELLKTVYLGDRSCKGVNVKTWEKRVEVHVNCISRVRAPSGLWDYYTDEDILDGRLVFVGVERLGLTPMGLLPNDVIHELIIVQNRHEGMFEFKLQMDSVTQGGTAQLLTMLITAAGFHLEDPARPGVVIDS